MASSFKPIFHQTSSIRQLCHNCRKIFLPTLSHNRLFTQDHKNRARFTEDIFAGLDELQETPAKPSKTGFAEGVSAALASATSKLGIGPRNSNPDSLDGNFLDADAEPPPHHLHVFSTKHNCHITLTDGKLQPLISVSAGNIGFRKAARGSYEAAFQLGAYVMARIDKQGFIKDIHSLEIILRDFGPGREAFTKILMGSDGKSIRDRVVRVMDSTKLKFGGTRSKKPRRL